MRGMKGMKGMKQEIYGVVLAIMAFNFTGCAIFQSPPVKYLPNDNSMIALNHIAEKAQQSTAVLAEIQAQNKNKQRNYGNYAVYSHRRYRKSYQTKYLQDSLQKSNEKVSFTFEGPVNKALQKLSVTAGYQFMIGASPLKSFPTIRIMEFNTPLSTIVMKINQQLPANIRVVCYPKTKSLLLVVQSMGA